MSRTRVYAEESIAVISRFFAAIDALVTMKKIRGKATYCRIANINRFNFYSQRNDYKKRILPSILDHSFGKGLQGVFRLVASRHRGYVPERINI